MSTTLLQSDLPGLPLRHRGKVRDVFDLPRERIPAAALASANADAAELKSTLEATAQKLTRASGKWGEDKASLERAKDALAAALLQIEEAEARPFE